MKLWFLLAILAVAACEKTSDVPAMQQELAGFVKNYTAKFDELEQRGSVLTARIKALPEDTLIDANNTLSEAANQFRGVKEVLDRAPNEIKAAVAAGKPDQLRQISDGLAGATTDKAPPAPPTDLELELGRASETLERRLEDGFVEINSGLDAVEAAIAQAETHPAPAKQAAKTETPATPAPAAPAPEAASGAGPAATR